MDTDKIDAMGPFVEKAPFPDQTHFLQISSSLLTTGILRHGKVGA
jgi:hypothetical protein